MSYLLLIIVLFFHQTGSCKGFGFVEFGCDEVAKIAAQTMNNYLMFNKLLKCKREKRQSCHGRSCELVVCHTHRSFCRHRESSQRNVWKIWTTSFERSEGI